MRQQVEPVIKARRLYHFLFCPQIPPQFLSDHDRVQNRKNPEYQTWEAQDLMLLSWLQTSLTSAIQPCVVGCIHTFELWGKIFVSFQKSQLHIELRTTKLEGHTVKEYLAKIKTLTDSLASVGYPVLLQDHLDTILEGLPQEDDSIISIVESKFDDSISIGEAETSILAQVHLQCCCKQTLH